MNTTPPYTVGIIAGQLVLGGAERQLYLWLSSLDRNIFRPIVVTLHPDAGDYWEPEIKSLGIPLLAVPRRQNRLARVFQIARCLRPFRPELIHAWHLFASPYGGAAAKLLGARASLGSLRGSFDRFQKSRLQAGMTLALVDALLVNSQAAGDRLISDRAHRRAKVFIVPNAVENHFQNRHLARSKLAERFGLDPSEIWIGSMGRIETAKKFDLLLDLMASLVRRGEHARLLLIGDGPSLQDLRAKAESLQIRNVVTFAGADPGARTWLNALDVFCFPSLDEGMPNVVMEAAAAGVPVVSWQTPFLEELLEHGTSALLATPGDLIELEQAVLAVIHDAGMRRRLGEAARKHVLQHYSVSRFVELMTLTYTQLLGERSP